MNHMIYIGEFCYPRKCVEVFSCVEPVNKKIHKINGLIKPKTSNLSSLDSSFSINLLTLDIYGLMCTMKPSIRR
jgi:hypothetical protein